MLAALKRGDRVVTGGGIIGTVQRVPMVADKDGKQVASNEIEVEIAPNIRVTVLRETIYQRVKPSRGERRQAGQGEGGLTHPVTSGRSPIRGRIRKQRDGGSPRASRSRPFSCASANS